VETANATHTLELLTWIAARPRSYPETLEVWRSSCPRLTIWEDAVAERLVRIADGRVTLSERGHAALGS